MPAAGRKDGKYVRKIHCANSEGPGKAQLRTRCGKHIPAFMCTIAIPEITCKTCRRQFAYWNQEDPQ